MRLAVTTSLSTTRTLEGEARAIAERLGASFIARGRESVDCLVRECRASRLIVVKPDRIFLYDPASRAEYAYHPNMVLVRAANLFRGAHDLFIEATDLQEGNRHLDATLGFGTEAILAQIRVGDSGSVTGLESVPELAEVTRLGLAKFSISSPRIAAAMRRIRVITADYADYLRACATDSYDVVYFDPFFGIRIPGSEQALDPLAAFGNTTPLDLSSLQEARRVARLRVVIKCSKRAAFPEALAENVSRIVTTRKSRLAYFVYEG